MNIPGKEKRQATNTQQSDRPNRSPPALSAIQKLCKFINHVKNVESAQEYHF